MSDVVIRAAVPGDVPLIVSWRKRTADWLASLGSDQWSDAGLPIDRFEERVRNSIAAGETWIAEVDGEPAATIGVDEHTDPGLWTPAEQQESVIVHRMITAPEFRGRGLGTVLLDHAEEVARQRGRWWVRLDAWTSNIALHRYYLSQGFKLARIADPNRPSAALFERPISRRRATPDATSAPRQAPCGC